MTHGDMTLYSADDTEQLIRNAAAKGMEEFWVSGEDKYPALVILVNGSYAYLNYFGAICFEQAIIKLSFCWRLRPIWNFVRIYVNRISVTGNNEKRLLDGERIYSPTM